MCTFVSHHFIDMFEDYLRVHYFFARNKYELKVSETNTNIFAVQV